VNDSDQSYVIGTPENLNLNRFENDDERPTMDKV